MILTFCRCCLTVPILIPLLMGSLDVKIYRVSLRYPRQRKILFFRESRGSFDGNVSLRIFSYRRICDEVVVEILLEVLINPIGFRLAVCSFPILILFFDFLRFISNLSCRQML